MRWLEVFLCPLAGMLVHGIGYFSFSIKFAISLIYTIGLREALWEWNVFPKNPTQMTCTSWPRVHEATTPHIHIKQIIWQLVESPLIIWGWVFYGRKIDDFASLSAKLSWLYAGLLIFRDVAISHNWPQIKTFRIIHKKLHNLDKIAKFKEIKGKYLLLTEVLRQFKPCLW